MRPESVAVATHEEKRPAAAPPQPVQPPQVAAQAAAPPKEAPMAMAPAPPSPTPNIAKEMEKLVAEARHSLHQVARHESRSGDCRGA